MATFVSEQFDGAALLGDYSRVDVELHGVDQAVPSYEGRIFLNNPDADEDAARDESSGYLGSFFVFGKDDCWGEEGHCDVREARKFDRRRDPTRFAKVRVTVPRERLTRLLQDGEDNQATVSIVAVVPETPDREHPEPSEVLHFERVSFITYG